MRDLSFVPVNGQGICQYARWRFGWLRFQKNGCGVLAVYNTLGLLGRKPVFSEVFGYFHAWYRLRLFGIFPNQLRRYYKKHKIPFVRVRSLSELEDLLQQGGVGVLTVWNRAARFLGKRIPNVFGGAHSMAVFYEESFTVCNHYSTRDRLYYYDSLQELVKDGILIQALYLKEETEKCR